MIIDFFTEERSTEITLRSLLPKLLSDGIYYNIYSFCGKMDLLKKLPKRLSAYHHDPLTTRKVVIMIDRDNRECHDLKNELEQYVSQAGLISKTANPNNFQVVTRIVIEELESWFIGDMDALNIVYPSVPTSLRTKSKYRNPDRINKPSIALYNILKRYTSEYNNGQEFRKCDVAERVSPYLSPEINRSESFQCFCEGVKSCCVCRR